MTIGGRTRQGHGGWSLSRRKRRPSDERCSVRGGLGLGSRERSGPSDDRAASELAARARCLGSAETAHHMAVWLCTQKTRTPPADSRRCSMAGLQGFEPQLPDPESGVQPLDDSPSVKTATDDSTHTCHCRTRAEAVTGLRPTLWSTAGRVLGSRTRPRLFAGGRPVAGPVAATR